MSGPRRHYGQLIRLKGNRTCAFNINRYRTFQTHEQFIIIAMDMKIRTVIIDYPDSDILFVHLCKT